MNIISYTWYFVMWDYLINNRKNVVISLLRTLCLHLQRTNENVSNSWAWIFAVWKLKINKCVRVLFLVHATKLKILRNLFFFKQNVPNVLWHFSESIFSEFNQLNKRRLLNVLGKSHHKYFSFAERKLYVNPKSLHCATYLYRNRDINKNRFGHDRWFKKAFS